MSDLVALATILAGIAVFLNTKAINLFKPKNKAGKYGTAGVVSTVLVVATRFWGAEFDLPDISDLSILNLIVLDVLVFAVAGGFWDILKLVGIRKPQ